MTITVPKLKNYNPVLVSPVIGSYTISRMTWQDWLRELELKYNSWINTYTATEMGMKDVNDLMQDLYPGPYRVVEQYLPDRMVMKFSLEFDDPKKKTFWILKNS